MEESEEKVVPLHSDLKQNLDSQAALEIFRQLSVNHSESVIDTCLPPVLPKAGELYVYDLGDDTDKWDSNKRKIRFFLHVAHIYHLT